MPRDTYTTQETEYISTHWQTMSDQAMADALNRSIKAIKGKRKRMGLLRPLPGEWSQQELDYLATDYPTTDTAIMAKKLRRTREQIAQRAHKEGIHKTDAYIKAKRQKCVEAGKKTRYQAGQQSWNKGKKQTDFMSAEKIANTVATRFKKGQKPHNTQPKNTTRIDAKDGYILIKIDDGDWQLKHRVIYERMCGPIPDGYVIWFRDRNQLNLAITNLELISTAEIARRNSPWLNYPREVAELLHLNNRIKKEITKQEGMTV